MNGLTRIIYNKSKHTTMTRRIKILALWFLTICGFASHSICDMLPMFWGKDMAVVASDGNVDQGMIVFMITLAFLLPSCGILCMLADKAKILKKVNVVLA